MQELYCKTGLFRKTIGRLTDRIVLLLLFVRLLLLRIYVTHLQLKFDKEALRVQQHV